MPRKKRINHPISLFCSPVFLFCFFLFLFFCRTVSAYDPSKGDWIDDIENRFTNNQKLALHFFCPLAVSFGAAELTDLIFLKKVNGIHREIIASGIGIALGSALAIGKEKFDESRGYPAENIKIVFGISGSISGAGIYGIHRYFQRKHEKKKER